MTTERLRSGTAADARNRRIIATRYLEVAELASIEEGPGANMLWSALPCWQVSQPPMRSARPQLECATPGKTTPRLPACWPWPITAYEGPR